MAPRLTSTFPEIRTRLPYWYFRTSLSAWIVGLLTSLFLKLSCANWGNVAPHLRLRNRSFISGEHSRRPELHSTADKLPALSHRFYSNLQFASCMRLYDVAHRPKAQSFFDYIRRGLLADEQYLGLR